MNCVNWIERYIPDANDPSVPPIAPVTDNPNELNAAELAEFCFGLRFLFIKSSTTTAKNIY
ncbi:hypothetical protein DERP_011865 [Dermatophagoides pteronyssinus]|uniref:Uncharacterized protein n=1 Tax=Dermatophagoides pteronyssinus TaxID=6956 RepID=A0ABQ8JRA1_DERPT|nr:hypothetical protein DERP_011865 [Dermatophagoides pteronyssinus]